MVKFYASWCGHCAHMANDYNRLAHHFSGRRGLAIVKIDADKHGSVRGPFNIQGYPTLKFIVDGRPHDVHGRRFDEMKSFIESRIG